MSNISRIGVNNPVSRVINNPVVKTLPTQQAGPGRATDRLELSGLSHLLKAAKTEGMRTDMIASIKSSIESGTYETDLKLDIATDRLLDDLQK